MVYIVTREINQEKQSNDLGIEVASEHAGLATENVTITNNKIKDNTHAGLALGSYKEEFGGVKNCKISGNIFSGNKLDIYRQFNIVNCQ